VTPRSYDAVVQWGRRTLPIYAAALQKLERLRPPAADADAVRSWLAADRKVALAVRDLVAAAEKRDFPSLSEAASRAQLAGSRSRSEATSLGMQVCGSLATTSDR